ncbi:MAG: 5-formyltetrahydrofolate cyclo-ligase [Crocinitomicaceae bacterium]
MTILEQKKVLREFMLKRRLNFDSIEKENYDAWVCYALEKKVETINAKKIHAYIPMGAEINIKPLLVRLIEKGITVVTPKTLPKPMMENLVLSSFDDLEKGVFGTSHPATNIEYKGDFDFIIIPGLAFDSNNYRLGYGGGYYDTFLAQHPTAFKQGVFYPFQEVAEVPIEEHDVQLNGILVKN